MEALRESDLTLNPVGKNTECYRIFEALSLGSVPVVENIMTEGRCGSSKISSKLHSVPSPLRLLKSHGAPLIYVSDWKELNVVLNREKTLSVMDIVHRRKNILNWYTSFRRKMESYFVSTIKKVFFGETS